MRLCGVSLTSLLVVIMVMKISRSDLVIKGTYHHFFVLESEMSIGFDNTNIKSFLNCVCTNQSKKCYVKSLKPNDYDWEVKTVTSSDAITSPANDKYLKIYKCQLEKPYLITCQRMTGSSSTNVKTFIYLNELNICQLQCVGIFWDTSQTVTFTSNERDILKLGSIPEICSSNSTTVTTSTMTTTMATKTTPTVRSTTTKKTSGTPKAIAAESTKTDINTSADDDTVLPGVTVSTNSNGSLTGSSHVPDNSTSAIVGVTVSFVLLIAVVLGVFFLIRWRKQQVKETESCMKSNITGSIVETSRGKLESSYSEEENENNWQKDVSKYQYSQINLAFITENSTHEYSNVKADPQENKSSDPNPQPTPLDKSSAAIVQSNGSYSLASVSNKQSSSKGKYSIPDHDTQKCKPHKARKNVNSQIPTNDTYSHFERTRQEHNKFAVFQDSPTLNYQLAMNINDAESQNKQEAASIDTKANTETKDYAVLGDQKREFSNPYNCSFDPTSSSIPTLPTDREPSQCKEKCENLSPDYCLASSLINNDKMSQLNSNSNTKVGGVQIVTSEYDLAKE